MLRLSRASILRTSLGRQSHGHRSFATAHDDVVRIVEVGPRDGLQNEKTPLSVDQRVELIHRLQSTGLQTIEAGSFVSPKWVPQMAGTKEILARLKPPAGSKIHYPVLVPNERGLDDFIAFLDEHPSFTQAQPEVSIFTAASDGFSRANTNTDVAGSLARLEPVARRALYKGMRVRGYVSTVDTCPYSGKVEAKAVRDVSRALKDMGCYEISLGDTTGTGTPERIGLMIEEVAKDVPTAMLAGHFHDTFGTSLANIFTALRLGLRTFDSSVGGLGGCPYSPGATGNVATEDVLYALHNSHYRVEGAPNLDDIVEIGAWVSTTLQKENVSRAGRAILARKMLEREKEKKKENRAKL